MLFCYFRKTVVSKEKTFRFFIFFICNGQILFEKENNSILKCLNTGNIEVYSHIPFVVLIY